MNNYSKMEERLKLYVDVMKAMNNKQEIDVMYTTLGDLKSLAEANNKNSKIIINSIKASEAPLIAFGAMSAFLIKTCQDTKREDILEQFRSQMVNIFASYATDKRFIDTNLINKEIEARGNIKLEYPEQITNMFLNTATILMCRVLLGTYISDIEESSDFIEKYLVENYLLDRAGDEVRQIMMK